MGLHGLTLDVLLSIMISIDVCIKNDSWTSRGDASHIPALGFLLVEAGQTTLITH